MSSTAARISLDDTLKHGDIRFAYDVFARFLARVDERIQMAEAELQKPQDFTIDEEMVREPDAIDVRQNARRGGRPLAPTREVRPAEGNGRQSPDGRGHQEAHQALRQHPQELAANRQRRAAGALPDGDDQRVRPAQQLHGPLDARELQHPDEAGARRHRRFAPRRRRLHRRPEHHPRRRGRQERRPQARGQDRRRRRRRQRPDGRHRRHEAQRRREEDPRQARHGRPAGSRAGRRVAAARRSPSPATASS